MDLAAPFEGTLLIPEKILAGDSPVTLDTGETVAQIRRPFFAVRHAFDILDAPGGTVGHGGAVGFFRRRWPVRRAGGTVLLEFTVAWTGPSGRSRILLNTGAELSLKGSWWMSRSFTVHHGDDLVAEIQPTTHAMSLRNDTYAFSLRTPLLSVIAAVGLAQSIRNEVQASRNRAHQNTIHHHT